MDTVSAEQRSRNMSRIASKNTQPELDLRSLLHAAGYRYQLHGALPARKSAAISAEHPDIRLRGGKLPGSPDLVFTAKEKVIFVNGCFWHGHDCPAGSRRPSSNTEYWNPKLDANIALDHRNRHVLASLGWESLTLWECELHAVEEVMRKATGFLGPPRTAASSQTDR